MANNGDEIYKFKIGVDQKQTLKEVRDALNSVKKEIQKTKFDIPLNVYVDKSKYKMRASSSKQSYVEEPNAQKEIPTRQQTRSNKVSQADKNFIQKANDKFSNFEQQGIKATKVVGSDKKEIVQYNSQLKETKSLLQQIERLTTNGIYEGGEKDIQEVARLKQQLNALFSSMKSNTLVKDANTKVSANAKAKANYNAQAFNDRNSKSKAGWQVINTQGEKAANANNMYEFKKANQVISETEAKLAQTKQTGLSMFDSWKKKTGDFVPYLLSFNLFPRIMQGIRQGIQTVKEYDTVLTEMRKVSTESEKSLRDYAKQSFKTADSVGTLSKTIQSSTADWMRLGESLEEAKKSATASAKLFDVSDFSSIDEASKGLMSISQAYKDIDKDTIVDKISYIGNNYSIATNELATGLKNSASALTVEGNNLDQAIGLVTSANAVVQDVDKASTGVRTISLRLAGTKSAREELELLGEETDSIIETTSKVRQTIKDFTQVASNGNKGFDILDDNGNLKSTYDIMLGLSEIYKEIQETDKKMGTNKAQGLLETIAGKNRSAIAASILTNPEMLKNVYESSKNDSQGSSNKNLEKYLDSFEGKLNKLKNASDRFWVAFVNSDAAKFVLDIATGFTNMAAALTEAAGSVPVILGLLTVIQGVKGEG